LGSNRWPGTRIATRDSSKNVVATWSVSGRIGPRNPIIRRRRRRSADEKRQIVTKGFQPGASLVTGENASERVDQLRNVITVGTFAKTLSANMRCGYILPRPDIIASSAELKMLATINSSRHIERLVHGLLEDGRYRKHLNRPATRIAKAD
jgi:DNA-binding transcriptional MocR family regulator